MFFRSFVRPADPVDLPDDGANLVDDFRAVAVELADNDPMMLVELLVDGFNYVVNCGRIPAPLARRLQTDAGLPYCFPVRSINLPLPRGLILPVVRWLGDAFSVGDGDPAHDEAFESDMMYLIQEKWATPSSRLNILPVMGSRHLSFCFRILARAGRFRGFRADGPRARPDLRCLAADSTNASTQRPKAAASFTTLPNLG